jgi:hypothetical protein
MRRPRADDGWACAVLAACVAACVPDIPPLATGGSSAATTSSGTTSADAGDLCGSVTGAQSSGTSAPVVAGPASGRVSAGASLAVAGVGITDAAAAQNPGAMVVVVSVGAGTVAMTASGAQVPGSGTSSITYSSTFSSINEALAALTYTAPGAAAGVVLQIKPTDQFGNTSVLSIPITVTSGSTCGGADGG